VAVRALGARLTVVGGSRRAGRVRQGRELAPRHPARQRYRRHPEPRRGLRQFEEQRSATIRLPAFSAK